MQESGVKYYSNVVGVAVMPQRRQPSDNFAGMQDSKFVCKMVISGHTRLAHKYTQLYETK